MSLPFSTYANAFAQNGFHHMDQLASENVSPLVLCDRVNINYGTACSIMDYAKTDTRAIAMGIC
jgi:hypothetical protein